MRRKPRLTLSARLMSRLDQLSAISRSPNEIIRLYLTEEHRAATELLSGWMREAGMAVTIDAAGTVVGRVEGAAPSAKTLLIGSHIDTVINAGRYDGCLGVVMAIEVVAELQRLGKQLPFAIEVLAFGDEEGVRFPRTLTGSHAIAGTLDPQSLNAVDADGTTMADALRRFGSNPDEIGGVARRASDVIGYIEVHIEQGPVLEEEGVEIGIVTAISGASRFRIELRGVSGHAGTLPMAMRRDALVGAAEMVLAIETLARGTPGLVATVGQIVVPGGAINVVPGAVDFTLDIRSPVDRTRRMAIQEIERKLRAVALRRHLTIKTSEIYNEKAVTCDQRFIQHLTAAADRLGVPTIGLPSGAGHDGLAISKLCPIGMLFVRCKGGISHHPDEAVDEGDVETAARVVLEFLSAVAMDGRSLV